MTLGGAPTLLLVRSKVSPVAECVPYLIPNPEICQFSYPSAADEYDSSIMPPVQQTDYPSHQ